MKTELARRDRLCMGEAEKMANYRNSCCLISCLFPTKELKRTFFQREKEFFWRHCFIQNCYSVSVQLMLFEITLLYVFLQGISRTCATRKQIIYLLSMPTSVHQFQFLTPVSVTTNLEPYEIRSSVASVSIATENVRPRLSPRMDKSKITYK